MTKNINNITVIIISNLILKFLIYKITKEYKNIEYLYQRFILERYLNKYNLKKSVIINNINNFYRNKRHLIKVEDKYFLEKEILNKIYYISLIGEYFTNEMYEEVLNTLIIK